ncbi:hypothetical protein SESBI_46782 [Sesbania bispinosa]|nr:hypothetical protein SESBI_46782 [Sesbania bispinosa]
MPDSDREWLEEEKDREKHHESTRKSLFNRTKDNDGRSHEEDSDVDWATITRDNEMQQGHQSIGEPSLDWPSRLKIVKGIAKAKLPLTYMLIPSLITVPHMGKDSTNSPSTRDRDLTTVSYIKHVLKEGREMALRNRQRKLYTNNSSSAWYGYKQSKWSHIVFEHPATFETLAIEQNKKEEIINDLVKFRNGKDYYAKIGKAWKSGYLLYLQGLV